MVRLRNSILFGIVLLASAAAGAAGLTLARGGPIAVSGVYAVTFHLQITSTLPAGSMLTCRARMTPIPGGLDFQNQQLAATTVAVGQVLVNGSTATCAAEIPFSWTVTSPPGGIALFYQIEAVSRQGAAPIQIRSSAEQQISAAFPVPGNANLTVDLIF